MCGICGKISVNVNSDINEKLVRRMCSLLTHRGPDDEGVYLTTSNKQQVTRVGLGHRRLSIIDLSQAGHQPMSNEDGSIWIVMNGEIYNFQELRSFLEKKGHIFKSRTDTEVVLHLYEDKGEDCFKELRGPFSFAIWDNRNNRLFMARDRLGQKPFYYFYKNQTLIFASEIKSILQDYEIAAEVNRKAVTDYLTYGYVPTPESMFKGIMKLPPAHFMIYKDGDINIERYWDLDFSRKISLSEVEYCDRIMDLLEESTKMRLVSDVPLGAFLSGGIDSSMVVYMMSRLTSSQVKTFSIGFEEKKYNELRYASIIARRFGTEHHEYMVKPNAIELLPKLVWHYNEPYADSSALPSYYVSKMTRQGVKVALNGDGGDECFGGYERFMAARVAERLKKMPVFLREKIAKMVSKAIPAGLDAKNHLTKLKRFVSMMSLSYAERHYNWVSIFKDSEKENLFTEGFNKEMKSYDSLIYLKSAFKRCASKDIVDLVMSADIRTNLLDDLLVKMDIATMANSMEGRSPFLDHKVMEFAASMPSNMKIRGMKLKYALKKALSKILPEEILLRGKMGFAVPLDRWFRDELKNYSYDILMSRESISRGYFKKEAMERLLDEHYRSKANNGSKIWSLLNLELWHKIFIDRTFYAKG